jgi:hypothetical protein
VFEAEGHEQSVREQEIHSELAPPHQHEHVGRIERFNQILGTRVACMFASLYGQYVPRKFWSYAVLLAVALLNLTPSLSNPEGKSPYEVFTGQKPSIQDIALLPFGVPVETKRYSEAWAFGEKSSTDIYLGPSFRSPGCIIVYNPTTGAVYKRGSGDYLVLEYIPASWNASDMRQHTNIFFDEPEMATWDCGLTLAELACPLSSAVSPWAGATQGTHDQSAAPCSTSAEAHASPTTNNSTSTPTNSNLAQSERSESRPSAPEAPTASLPVAQPVSSMATGSVTTTTTNSQSSGSFTEARSPAAQGGPSSSMPLMPPTDGGVHSLPQRDGTCPSEGVSHPRCNGNYHHYQPAFSDFAILLSIPFPFHCLFLIFRLSPCCSAASPVREGDSSPFGL